MAGPKVQSCMYLEDPLSEVPLYDCMYVCGTVVGVVLVCIASVLHHVREKEEGEDDGSTVSRSAKKQLLKADRALQRGSYSQAESACHSALGILMQSEHAEKKAYLEASAFTMDKVG